MSFLPEVGDSPLAASTTISSEKSAWTMAQPRRSEAFSGTLAAVQIRSR
jgi:hypothetical protein